MSRMQGDPELDGIFGADAELESIARLLHASHLTEVPLDPAFKNALRRQLVTAAFDRRRPSYLARLFGGPGFAFATAAMAVLLVAVIVLQNPSLLGGSGGNQVVVRTLGSTEAVAVNQPITLTFSQPMDHQSVQNAIHIEPATQVSYQWQGNNLLIQPASGQLAANTQYHIVVASTATTERGRPIGQPAVVEVNTAPIPVATPRPSASPSPTPQAAITSERNLVPNGTAVGWSPDGLTLYYLVNGGELGAVRSDGTNRRSLIGTGVTRAALSADGLSLAAVAGGKLMEVPAAGGPATAITTVQPPTGVGWQGAKVLYWSVQPGGVTFYLAGEAAPIATSTVVAGGVLLSPDGSKASIGVAATDQGPAGVRGSLTFVDFAAKTQKSLAPANSGAWDNASARVAYIGPGGLFVGAPDGTAGKLVLTLPDLAAAAIAWTPAEEILVSADSGTWLVKPDGSGTVQLRGSGIGSGLAVAPGSSRAAAARTDGLWAVEIGAAKKSALDLGAGATLVAQYLSARIAGDPTRAGGLLTASAARTVSPGPTGEPHLARFFLIASEATPENLRFVARLIFAKGAEEVRYQDELLLVVAATGGALQVDGIVDSPARDLGNGPTVNSVTVQPGGLAVLFDSDLDPATAAAAARISGGDRAIPVTATYAKRQLTITAPLVAGHHYRLELSDQLRDIDGKQLQGGYTFDFVAAATPGS